MSIPNQSPHPTAEITDQQAGAPMPPSIFSSRSGALFHSAQLGTEVTFRRSATDEPEQGIVRSREFGTQCIEVVDTRGKPLRIGPDQYEITPLPHQGAAETTILRQIASMAKKGFYEMPKSTHGRHPPSAANLPNADGGTDDAPTFDCPLWPGCDCPAGTMRVDCPGLAKQ
jgi:hypothetical protein